MRLKIAIYSSIILFTIFTPSKVDSKILDEPYKMVRQYLNEEIGYLYVESINPGSTKKPFYIAIKNMLLESNRHVPSQMKFFNSDFQLIDAVNTSNNEKFLCYDLFLSDFDNDGVNEVIVPIVGENKVKLILVNLINGQCINSKFLEIPFVKKDPFLQINYLKISNDLLIIFVNTLFPGKHDYRRIFGINPRNFNVLWEKPSIDFMYRGFIPNNNKSKSFFYLSLPYNNGLIFSNNTFYRLIDKEKTTDKNSLSTVETIVDTFFGKKAFPYPDSSANDYANDAIAYLVKMDFSGETIKRIEIANKFSIPKVISFINPDSLLFFTANKHENNVTIYNYSDRNSQLKELIKFNHNTLITIKRYDNSLYFIDKDKRWQNKLNKLQEATDSLYFENPSSYTPQVVENNTKYYFVYVAPEYKLLDNNFDVIAKFKEESGYIIDYYSSKDLFVLRKENSTKFYKLEKKAFFERLNDTTFKWISIALSAVLFITLILWLITMYLSRKKIEENYYQLNKSKKNLEIATSQLVRSEKLAALGTIASAVAHQLNSPLGAILNSAQRLHSTFNENENVNLIIKASERSKKIVERFLITSRNNEEEICTTNILKSIDDFFELFGYKFSKSGIVVIKNLSEDINVKIRPSYMDEVLINIFFNALDSIVESGKTDGKIIISVNHNNKIATIEFKDTGTGFNDEILDRKFEAFLTTKEKGKGTGLGLWIVEKIITETNGKIDIGNYKDGAFVIFEIPIVNEGK